MQTHVYSVRARCGKSCRWAGDKCDVAYIKKEYTRMGVCYTINWNPSDVLYAKQAGKLCGEFNTHCGLKSLILWCINSDILDQLLLENRFAVDRNTERGFQRHTTDRDIAYMVIMLFTMNELM